MRFPPLVARVDQALRQALRRFATGVYMVWCKTGDQWSVMDVGESANVQERVLNHDRAPQWKRHCSGVLYFAAHYTPNAQQPGRRDIDHRVSVGSSSIGAAGKPPIPS